MPPPFRQVNRAQFAQLLEQFQFTRRVTAVHFHHTSVPNHQQFRGHESVVSMFRHHTVNRGFRDIAQHVTIAPDGTIFLGRNWNLPPASSVGANGTRLAGPFMFETVGNFNVGRDPFTDPQRRTVITVIALVQRRFGLPSAALNFHREFASTDCPGGSLHKADIISAVEQIGAGPVADTAGPDPLSHEGLRADLSADEAARGEGFDLDQVLREMRTAEQAGDDLASEDTLDEEDTHDAPAEGQSPGAGDGPRA
jgi:hypothetical protein